MTTDFVTLPQALTAGEALARLRALDEPPDPLYHVYLVPEEGSWHLLGVVPLRALALADPATPLTALQHPEFRLVRADEHHREVAHMMAEYDLPDLPVVDEAGDILGVVLIDDAVDALYPDLWRRRLMQGVRR
jgi:magnesium transporter